LENKNLWGRHIYLLNKKLQVVHKYNDIWKSHVNVWIVLSSIYEVNFCANFISTIFMLEFEYKLISIWVSDIFGWTNGWIISIQFSSLITSALENTSVGLSFSIQNGHDSKIYKMVNSSIILVWKPISVLPFGKLPSYL
jgi:hypothetical protein